MVSLASLRERVDRERRLVALTRSFNDDVDVDGFRRNASATGLLCSIVMSNAEQRSRFVNLVKWGALATAVSGNSSLNKFATDEIVNTGILLVANHCEIKDLGVASTQTPNLLVDSFCTQAAINKYVADGRPRGDDDNVFSLPRLGGSNGLKALRAHLDKRASTTETATLADLPGVINTTFVLHGSHHWSLMVYSRTLNELTFYDSLGALHHDLALTLAHLLISARLVPNDCAVRTLAEPVFQRGGWQCGYATIVMAAWVGDALTAGITPRDIVGNDRRLLQFIGDMLIKSMQNRAIERQTQWHWFYEI
jgi:hypothetical protein